MLKPFDERGDLRCTRNFGLSPVKDWVDWPQRAQSSQNT